MTIHFFFRSGGAESLHQQQQPGAAKGDEARSEAEVGTGDVGLRREDIRAGAVRRLDHRIRRRRPTGRR